MFPPLAELRIPGVLQRFAVCYLTVSLLAVCVSRKRMAVIACIILAVYATLTYVGGGFEYGEGSLLAAVDHTLLGTNIMNDGGCDPEGILSTLPSIAHTIIGFCVGGVITSQKTSPTNFSFLLFGESRCSSPDFSPTLSSPSTKEFGPPHSFLSPAAFLHLHLFG